MDITETIAPRSDQLNAEDLLTGPRTFTVEKVTAGSVEQPVEIHLIEFPGRPFKPSKTVRRILVAAWGPEAANYVGRRMTLYRDASVKFGGMDVGGIRVSHLSHIDKRMSLALTVTRGKRAPFVVEPLANTSADVTEFASRIDEATTLDDLDALARELKAIAPSLGARNRGQLQDAWKLRRAAITEAATATEAPAELPTEVTNEPVDDEAAAMDAARDAAEESA